MRAIVYQGAGGLDVISLTERPTPVPGPEQVLVRVRAAGLNRADLIQRKGHYAAPPGWPADIPGLEYAGEVAALGSGVTSVSVGDRVMGLVGGGAQAEFLVAHEREILEIPDSVTDPEAAGIPEAFLTAYDALTSRGRLRAGERVLIHAVGSGVSTVAVQLAKWLGATVIGTSRTALKLERARALGLDLGIDTSLGGFGERLPAPVDVILDFFGGPALSENIAALAPRGRLVLLGTMQGPTAASVDLGRILRNRLEVIGTVMRARQAAERVPLVAEFTTRVLPEIASGRLRPIIGATFPMTAIADAHRAMEANEVFGKIVLTW
jgi:putative PIG3 family NAD(P)H quinone oxidoreductase